MLTLGNRPPFKINAMKNFFFILLLTFVFSCQNQETSDVQIEPSEDSLSSKTIMKGALCGSLHTITLATNSLDSARLFYVDALGMTLEGPFKIPNEVKDLQRKFWNIPDEIDWDTYRLHRPSVSGLIQIRLMVLDQITPLIHKGWNPRELGPFTIGFPNLNQVALDNRLNSHGFSSRAPLQEGRIPRPDGTSYRYIETVYKAPDFVHAVGIERKDGMPQLAPVDSLTELGGPGYSGMILEDSDTFLKFLTEVMDLELRSDRHWKTSPGSALGVEEGIPFRFSLVYAKGQNHGHLLFMDYEDDQFVSLEVEPKIPNRGLGMWTFQTSNIDELKSRLENFGSPILYGPTSYEDPILGKKQVMTFLAPNGFLMEVFQ